MRGEPMDKLSDKLTEKTEAVMQTLADHEFYLAVTTEPDLATELDAISGKDGDVWLTAYCAAIFCGRETDSASTDWYSAIMESRGVLPVHHYNGRPYYAVSDLEEWLHTATLH
jgi:hypothetical protein